MGYTITGEGGFESRINPLVTSSAETMETTEAITGSVSAAPESTPWDEGFNFRASVAYVTDPADTQAVEDAQNAHDSAASYPITANGVTFGWNDDGALEIRDRDNTAGNEKLAGCHWGSELRWFTVDLPDAGNYTVDLALGDPAGGAGPVSTKIYDGTTEGTLKATISGAVTSGQFRDASGNLHTSVANWKLNHVPLAVTFATTTLTVTVEASLAPISHLFVHKVCP